MPVRPKLRSVREADRSAHFCRGSRPLLRPGHRAEGSCRFALPVWVVWRSRTPSASRRRSRAFAAALLHACPASRSTRNAPRKKSQRLCEQLALTNA